MNKNRLINETSPYLRQHAANPVDWYPWGEEALEKAVGEDKPIILSIGYSSCHWCHVMAHEVFENEEIAALMNQHFICIKVDREERPDLDKIYMDFVQSIYGSGGWPLNVFLTPELIPFFGGTYFPPVDAMGLAGFKTVLLRMYDFYQQNREEIKKGGADLAARLSVLSSLESSDDMLDKAIVDQLLEKVYDYMDRERGGFGQSNKFPHPMLLSFLLQHVHSHPKVAKNVRLTLDNMANRGLYDHIGGGFYRYCTDSEWRVPHFEKMLYDNALISSVFLEAYQLWEEPRYREVVEETLDFVLREMTHRGGGFFSTIDADSDGEEGRFYVWEPKEIAKILGDKIGKIVGEYYGVSEQGNFSGAKSVLLISGKVSELAHKYHMSETEIKNIIQTSRRKLFQARKQRGRPGVDNKSLTAWNGMMIYTLASAFQILGNSRYLQAAETAADFIEQNMERNGRYYRIPIGDQRPLKGYLCDYAFMVRAYLSLFEATAKIHYLNKAERMTRSAVEFFWDRERKGFFFTPHDHEKLFLRVKEATDGVIPSGNAVFAHNLLKLYAITTKDFYRKTAVDLMKSSGTVVKYEPIAAASWLAAYHFWWGGNQQLILVGFRKEREIFRQIQRKYLPNKVLVWLEPKELPEPLAVHTEKKMLNGLPTLYICQNFSCQEPLSDPKRIDARLDSLQ